ncbi:MAG TPA: hypothetical protein VMH88_06440 [Gemmatimonadales bacterium]|nr:hypothetical protein [Gemmatimonadales bacterium]
MTDVDIRGATRRVEIERETARYVDEHGAREFPIRELPEQFIQWQLDYKRRIYDAISKDEYIAFNAGHLPVVGTWSGEDQTFFANLANKGVGFTPKDEHLEYYVKLVEDAVERIQGLPPHAVDETRDLRVKTAREFYAHPEHIDWRRLGLLEIFEGETYRNLMRRPFASVLWTGNSPVFVSYQVDCVVEIIATDHPRYRFSWAMRRLFEYEPFHVVQTMFPYAYTFWVTGWHDKTPKRRYK